MGNTDSCRTINNCIFNAAYTRHRQRSGHGSHLQQVHVEIDDLIIEPLPVVHAQQLLARQVHIGLLMLHQDLLPTAPVEHQVPGSFHGWCQDPATAPGDAGLGRCWIGEMLDRGDAES